MIAPPTLPSRALARRARRRPSQARSGPTRTCHRRCHRHRLRTCRHQTRHLHQSLRRRRDVPRLLPLPAPHLEVQHASATTTGEIRLLTSLRCRKSGKNNTSCVLWLPMHARALTPPVLTSRRRRQHFDHVWLRKCQKLPHASSAIGERERSHGLIKLIRFSGSLRRPEKRKVHTNDKLHLLARVHDGRVQPSQQQARTKVSVHGDRERRGTWCPARQIALSISSRQCCAAGHRWPTAGGHSSPSGDRSTRGRKQGRPSPPSGFSNIPTPRHVHTCAPVRSTPDFVCQRMHALLLEPTM